MPVGFLLLAVILLGAPIAVVLFGIWFDWWINRTADVAFPYHDLASLREVLLERESED